MNEHVISLIIGVGVFSLGLYRRRKRSKFMKSGLHAKGQVVDLLSQRGTFPIVRFTTIEGKEIQKTYELGSRPAAFKIGQTVEVYYRSEYPENFILNSNKDISIEIIFMIAGLVVGGFSVYMLFFKNLGSLILL